MKTIYEYCPNCQNEAILNNQFIIQKCNHCGAKLLPCSICEDNDCQNCIFTKENKN